MGRFLLTREDIEKLKKNKYVAKASETTITYTSTGIFYIIK